MGGSSLACRGLVSGRANGADGTAGEPSCGAFGGVWGGGAGAGAVEGTVVAGKRAGAAVVWMRHWAG